MIFDIKNNMDKELEKEFISLIEENKKIIYKVSLMYSDDQEDLNDKYQDIVLNLWTAFPRFKGDSKRSTWVYQIALNTCVSELRKRKSRPLTCPITYDIEELFDDGDEYKQHVRKLYEMINQLTKFERAIIMLWLDEKSYDEISEVLGISKSNVGVKINRIKEKLIKMSNK